MAKKANSKGKALRTTTTGVLCACYNYIIGVPSNVTGKLFSKQKPTWQIENKYGWTAEVYEFDFGNFEACVTIGAFPFGNVYPSKEICDKYTMIADMLAQEDWDVMQSAIYEFVVDCIKETANNNKVNKQTKQEVAV